MTRTRLGGEAIITGVSDGQSEREKVKQMPPVMENQDDTWQVVSHRPASLGASGTATFQRKDTGLSVPRIEGGTGAFLLAEH